jgi:dTDP-4-dehydrorhamnose reductase
MRVLVTGLNGTLAPHVARQFAAAGHTIVAWDRAQVDPEAIDPAGVARHLDAQAVDGVVHLAMGSERWAAGMAAHMGRLGLPFVFTSTAMVFDARSGGPHHIGDSRTAADGYGTYKIRCEDAVLAANPAAVVARIGWQIDLETRSGNNMVAHLQAQAAQGPVRASRLWTPAASHMADTAAGLSALFGLAQAGQAAGVHHLDSNARSALTFPQIVAHLARQAGMAWAIEVTTDYAHDQRLMPAPRADTVVLPDWRQDGV